MPEKFYLNGYMPPRIDVYSGGIFIKSGNEYVLSGASLVEKMYLEPCNVSGQPEKVTSDEDITKLQSGELVQKVHGFRFDFILHYDNLSKGKPTEKILRLFNYKGANYTLELFPNRENTLRKYYVLLVSDLDWKLTRNSPKAEGYENIILEFTSKFTNPSIESYDPTLWSQYFTDNDLVIHNP